MKMVFRGLMMAALTACLLFCGGKTAYAIESGTGDTPLSSPDTLHLSIAKNYLAFADSDVLISLVLTDTLSGALATIQTFNDIITFNTNILEFIDVRNGVNTPTPDWTPTKTISATPGIAEVGAISITTFLKGPGEILQLLFHVKTQTPTFSTSNFIVDSAVFGSDPSDPVVISDTGALLVIDACVPVVSLGAIPTSSVMQISSNPAVQSTSISYFISESADQPLNAGFRIYNAAGCLVRMIDNADAAPGWHDFQMNISDLSDGVYSLEFQAGATHQLQRLLVLH